MTETLPDADPIEAAPCSPSRRAAACTTWSRPAEPVGRDEAAAALGISRELAAFHLDRLVAVRACLRRSTGA